MFYFENNSLNIAGGGSQNVFSGSQVIRVQFPGDPLVHFCNGYFEFHLLVNKTNDVLLKIIAEIGDVFISHER